MLEATHVQNDVRVGGTCSATAARVSNTRTIAPMFRACDHHSDQCLSFFGPHHLNKSYQEMCWTLLEKSAGMKTAYLKAKHTNRNKT